MFAVLLHESMNPFHQTVTSFPTVIYTVLLIISLLYWIVAVLGWVDIEMLDLDMDGDIDINDSIEAQTGIAGILLKLGLNGVPLTIVISIIALIGWVLSYYIILFGSKLVPNLWAFEFAFKLGTFVGVTIITIFTTAQIIKPIRTLFKKLDVNETKHILGQIVVIRSSIANNNRGEAFMNDGGAGLLLNVRTTGTDEFKKGDEVVVIEHNPETNLYRVVDKSEFNDN